MLKAEKIIPQCIIGRPAMLERAPLWVEHE